MSSMTSRMRRRLDADKKIPRKLGVAFLMSPQPKWRRGGTRAKRVDCRACGSTAQLRCLFCRPCAISTYARRELKKQYRAHLAELNKQHRVGAAGVYET